MKTNNYYAVVAPWAIYRRLGAVKHVCIGRFRPVAQMLTDLGALIRQMVDNLLD
ncbi:MAG: hypothetical protein ACHBN1_28880 [Heteroscytonema crispum UTEX LB 1556]